jgi:hypothetical protein
MLSASLANAGWRISGNFAWGSWSGATQKYSCKPNIDAICVDCSGCSTKRPTGGDKAILKTPAGDVEMTIISGTLSEDYNGNIYELDLSDGDVEIISN